MQITGVDPDILTGDTFTRYKNDIRGMSQSKRFEILSDLQLRLAAIYAVQLDDLKAGRTNRQPQTEQRGSQLEPQNVSSQSRQNQRIQQSPFHFVPQSTEFIFPVPGFDMAMQQQEATASQHMNGGHHS
jgi:hypothetical protein